MLAPTSGVQGRGKIGAALSLGIESGPDFRIRFICTQVNKYFYTSPGELRNNSHKASRRRSSQNVCLRGAAFQTPEQTPDGPLPAQVPLPGKCRWRRAA